MKHSFLEREGERGPQKEEVDPTKGFVVESHDLEGLTVHCDTTGGAKARLHI